MHQNLQFQPENISLHGCSVLTSREVLHGPTKGTSRKSCQTPISRDQSWNIFRTIRDGIISVREKSKEKNLNKMLIVKEIIGHWNHVASNVKNVSS